MPRLPYPPARRQHLVELLPAGQPTHRVADPYRWLEDPAAAETAAWSAAQDELTRALLDGLPGRDRLRERLSELFGAGVVSAPSWRLDRQFLMRRAGGQEHAVLVTIDPDGTQRVLIDPMAVDPSGSTTLDAWSPSKEGLLLAYQLSEGGTEESTLRVMDVRTGEPVEGPIERVRYSPVAWLPGGEAYYYVRRLAPESVPHGEEQFHRRVWLHTVGTDPDKDVMVLGEGLDMTNYYGVSVSMDGRWLIVGAAAGTAPRNDLWLADLAASSPERPELRLVQHGVDAQTAAHVGRDGRVYVFTDRDSPRGRLAVTDPLDPSYSTWVDLVGEDPEAVLEDYAILDGAELERPVLLCGWTRHAVSEVSVHDLRDGTRIGTVPLPGLGAIGGISVRPEGGHEAWFDYTDHVTPSGVYRFDASDGTTTLWATPPGHVEVPTVVSRQEVYTSADGTQVHMFVISQEQTPSRPRPAILYGYGGFAVPMTPAYSAGVLAWVESGGVYAIANLRGGAEEGEQWHRMGMREHKQNVFDDFHAAAEHLIASGWTSPAQLGISGGSNGGLLVGAALTQRPERYAAVVCAAPLLDMARYQLFGLCQTWTEEYGDATDPEQLGWLLAYSPYHQVRDGVAYPATLFTVFDGDTRVDPLHARKMCAALQAATTAEAPVLIRREGHVGHGARAVSRSIELAVDTLSFTAAHTGLRLG